MKILLKIAGLEMLDNDFFIIFAHKNKRIAINFR